MAGSCTGQLLKVDKDHIMVPFKPRVEWVSLVKTQQMELTANKLANMPVVSDNQKNRKVRNGTSILLHHYFNHHSHIDAATNADIVSTIVMSFKLNTEQTRVFRIVTDHAVGPQL